MLVEIINWRNLVTKKFLDNKITFTHLTQNTLTYKDHKGEMYKVDKDVETSISISPEKAWQSKFAEFFNSFSNASYNNMDLQSNCRLLKCREGKISDHLAFNVSNESTNFTKSPGKFVEHQWSEIVDVKPDRFSWTHEFFQSRKNDLTTGTTPYTTTSDLEKYFTLDSINPVASKLSGNLDELYTDIHDLPNFFFITLICLLSLFEALPEIIKMTSFDTEIIEELLKAYIKLSKCGVENMPPMENIEGQLREVLLELTESLKSSDLSCNRDKLLYLQDEFNSIEIKASIKKSYINDDWEGYQQFKLNQIKFYQGTSRLL